MSLVLSVIIILAAVFLYSLVHSLLASLRLKALVRSWLGSIAERAYRLVYNIFAVITLIPILALPLLLPDKTLYVIPLPWSILTIILQLLAAYVLLIGLLPACTAITVTSAVVGAAAAVAIEIVEVPFEVADAAYNLATDDDDDEEDEEDD